MIDAGVMLRGVALVAISAALGGCLSFENDSRASTVANIIMFQSTTPPKPAGTITTEGGITTLAVPNTDLTCPPVTIAVTGAAIRSYGGQTGDSQGVRNQLAINDVARECSNSNPDGSFTLKIGPAGSPGTYQANLRMVVLRSGKPVATRVVRVGATIAPGQGGADFVHVEENILVPPGTKEPDIEVSLDNGGAARPSRRR